MNSPGPAAALPAHGAGLAPARLFTRPVVSWALYDMANTMFSMNIVSFFLSVWITSVMGHPDSTWAYTLTLSYAIIFVASPSWGP
jgi:MFS transporter, UMF1 family